MAVKDFVVYKFEGEKWAIGFRYFAPDLNYPTETIQSCVVSVSPAGLTLEGAALIDKDTVGQVVSGGGCNQNYHVHFTTTTSVGFILEDEIIVKVR